MAACPEEERRPRSKVRLPRSSTRNARPWAHCRILTSIRGSAYGNAFEGKIFRPGALVDDDALGERAVVFECAGPITPGWGHRRSPVLWILWRYDRNREEWTELARSVATNMEYIAALRPAALAALYPRAELIDLIQSSRELADEILSGIDERLSREIVEVRLGALSSIYDQVAGRLADQAAC